MRLDFERGTDPSIPLTVRVAVDRGHALVNRPVKVIMGLVMAVGALFAFVMHREMLGYLVIIGAPFVAWIWWSYSVPRWRSLALGGGVKAAKLQAGAQRGKVVCHGTRFFEKTEVLF